MSEYLFLYLLENTVLDILYILFYAVSCEHWAILFYKLIELVECEMPTLNEKTIAG